MRIALAALVVTLLLSVADASEWAIAYEGDYWTNSLAIQEVTGGYVFTGKIFSNDNGDDFWVVKLDSNGSIQWQKAYGGSDRDEAYAIQQTSDGGYIVAGTTVSFGSGGYDFWVVKLDANGNIQWQKTYGGSGDDYLHAIQQTSDGGYIVAGTTYSFLEGWWDTNNGWILKLDSNGNIEWQKILKIGGAEEIYAIRQTTDGGYILVGTVSYAYGPGSYHDLWVIKLSSNGNIQWQKAYGGSGWDIGRAVQQTSDGGYIVAGETWSFGSAKINLWILKLDSSGNVEWQKAYSRGEDENGAKVIQQTSDGGYIAVGYTSNFSYGGSNYDAWILKLDSSGNVEWQKAYGGSDRDEAYAIQQTSDGGYIAVGYTKSFGSGWGYAWILKLDSNGNIPDCGAIINSDINVTLTSADPVSTDADVEITTGNTVNTNAIARTTSATLTEVCYAVSNHLPVASFTFSPSSPVVGQTVTFDASSSYDPDGYVEFYFWDLGDGVVVSGGPVISYSYSQPGTYTVTLTVTDNDGLTSSTSKQITVQSSTPPSTEVTRSLPSWTEPGSTFQVTLTSTASALGMQITETIPSTFTFINYTYSGADSVNLQQSGNTLTFTVTDMAANGFTITYTLQAPSTAGSYTFSGTYQAMGGSTYAVGGDTTITVSAGESNPDNVDDTLEQLVTKYCPSFDWTTDTPTQQDVVQAVTNAVSQYFSTTDPAVRQEIVDNVIQLVQLYFQL